MHKISFLVKNECQFISNSHFTMPEIKLYVTEIDYNVRLIKYVLLFTDLVAVTMPVMAVKAIVPRIT